MISLPSFEAADYVRFVRLNAADCFQADNAAARLSALAGTAALLGRAPEDVLGALPKLLGECFEERGWAWNGFYGLRPDGNLQLAYACGPPVCSELAARGGALTSGMCFDSLALNQTLAAFEAKAWPGYVSCDAESQLGTVAGIVVPLRNPAGAPIGCWDLDSIQAIEPADVRFMDVLLSTLARCVEFEPTSFGSGF